MRQELLCCHLQSDAQQIHYCYQLKGLHGAEAHPSANALTVRASTYAARPAAANHENSVIEVCFDTPTIDRRDALTSGRPKKLTYRIRLFGCPLPILIDRITCAPQVAIYWSIHRSAIKVLNQQVCTLLKYPLAPKLPYLYVI